MNSNKRNADLERATIAKAHGIDASELPGFLTEIPFGNQTVIQQSAESKAPPAIGNLTKAAVLALAAGAVGFGAKSLLDTPKPEVPPPVDAVIEWEITPNGTESGGSATVRTVESGILEATSNSFNADVGGSPE